jgi:Xaa-Pro dipeptidase
MELKKRLSKIFERSKVDMIILYNDDEPTPNFRYLTDFKSGTFEENFLVATKEKEYLFTSDLEYYTAKSQSSGEIEVLNTLGNKKKFDKKFSMIKGKEIGINEHETSVAVYNFIKKYKPKGIKDVTKNFTKARLIKDDSEISNIRKAVSITKFAILEVQKSLREGLTELEVAAQVDFAMRSLGANGTAFETIVAFGKNAALPHHIPDSTRLKKDDIVLIDTGAKYNNYCADITRTFVFGKPDKEVDEMLKLVKSAQLKAIHMLKPGADAYLIYQKVKKYIDSYHGGKYKGKFIHALGHSIGLEVHDANVFGKTPYRHIKKGMTLAVEPGVYVEGFGGVRIEDDVLIDESGAIVL